MTDETERAAVPETTDTRELNVDGKMSRNIERTFSTMSPK